MCGGGGGGHSRELLPWHGVGVNITLFPGNVCG